MKSLKKAFAIFALMFFVNSIPVFATNNTVQDSSFSVPSDVGVWMFELEIGTGYRIEPPTECYFGNTNYGCTAYVGNTYRAYLYQNNTGDPYYDNWAYISIENDYLLDVVVSEMSPNVYHPVAVEAQAVTARSFILNRLATGGYIDNSATSTQVFVPYAFEYISNVIPNNTNDPCASTNLGAGQKVACNAVQSGLYLSYGNDIPISAEFSGDMAGWSLDSTAPYMKGVADPISTGCDSNWAGNGFGLSSEGASRWARGDECSRDNPPNNATGQLWSVKWDTAEQILFHYFTGVDLRDPNFNNGIISPSYRWNPLKISGDIQPEAILQPGQTYQISVDLQNTGISAWECSANTDYALGWKLEKSSVEIAASDFPVGRAEPFCNQAPGETNTFVVDVAVPATNTPMGVYQLKLDMYQFENNTQL